MVRKTGAIVQAHMSSTRLPQKVLKLICGKTVLEHDINRLKKIVGLDNIIIATSIKSCDDEIYCLCKKNDIDCYRGSDDNVLERFYFAAKAYQLTDIVRICSDNPLLDYNIISEQLKMYFEGSYAIVKSGENIPLGMGGEIFPFVELERAYKEGNEPYHFEHVTPYIYEHASNVGIYDIEDDFSKYRFTMDTEQDFELLSKIYEALYDESYNFSLVDIVDAMQQNPEWHNINAHIRQKAVK